MSDKEESLEEMIDDDNQEEQAEDKEPPKKKKKRNIPQKIDSSQQAEKIEDQLKDLHEPKNQLSMREFHDMNVISALTKGFEQLSQEMPEPQDAATVLGNFLIKFSKENE